MGCATFSRIANLLSAGKDRLSGQKPADFYGSSTPLEGCGDAQSTVALGAGELDCCGGVGAGRGKSQRGWLVAVEYAAGNGDEVAAITLYNRSICWRLARAWRFSSAEDGGMIQIKVNGTRREAKKSSSGSWECLVMSFGSSEGVACRLSGSTASWDQGRLPRSRHRFRSGAAESRAQESRLPRQPAPSSG